MFRERNDPFQLFTKRSSRMNESQCRLLCLLVFFLIQVKNTREVLNGSYLR